MKKYKVVSQREVLRPPYDEENMPERQLEDFLNKQAEEGWYYRDMITSLTADHRLGIEFVVLESDRDSY
ncbi:MAG: hypothetical protein JW753_02170 [Dehalococcoidia bacterium]|nr:hypothetical protein [Dehalococcoidia bacterium]